MRKSTGGFLTKLTSTRKLIRKSASKQDLKTLGDKITLGRVLGLTTTNTNGLACNTATGFIAYPAGCVIVLLDPKTNLQKHIFNPDKKTITCVAFSSDGKYLVSGESGQQPSVRVWELGENVVQVAELRGHKSGITAVEFSPNQKLLVSIGDQHDMLVNVWNWKLGHTVACNKSGCRVRSVSFSEDGNYLVTVGNRHVKFWYIDSEASSKGNVPITPINGRSGILGEQRNNCFTDVMCGRGRGSNCIYCVSKSGLLFMFSEKRVLDKWVDLKAGCANCLFVSERYIFCGCSDGVIRIFEPITLRYVATLPKPHNLGVNVSDGITPNDLGGSAYTKNCPDLVALTVDTQLCKLTSIYNDHSMYLWDVADVKKVGKVGSFLYHSACIWGVETYPCLESNTPGCVPNGSFLTCSSDDTIRIWNLDTGVHNTAYPRNLYSKELLKVVYIDEGLANLQDTSMAPFGKDSDSKNGVRCMQISPNGKVIATGDRNGNLRVFDMHFFDIIITVEAHEAEILCVEFSLPESGYDLLASSSRDRLIHIFDVNNDYVLLQTIDDHSSSITAVRFNYDMGTLQLLSCGADKVVMFHTAQSDHQNVTFIRNTIVPGKSTLYDMGIEPTRRYAATVGQDRNLRIYDIQGAKQISCYKGSLSDEGNLIKFQLDGGGVYAAVSCSDKTICIFDFEAGDCEAAVYGHSELVTGLKFTADGKHMISVSGDGCIFIWNLPIGFTENILNRMNDLNVPTLCHDYNDDSDARRKTFIVSNVQSGSTTLMEFANGKEALDNVHPKSPLGYRFSIGQLPLWAQKQIGAGENSSGNKGSFQPLGRWGERELALATVDELTFKNDLKPYSHDSTNSLSSDKSTLLDAQTSNDVIFPSNDEDINSIENERNFEVTETKKHHKLSTTYKLATHNDDVVPNAVSRGGGVIASAESESDGIEECESTDENDDADDEDMEDDDGDSSPLVDHFEKLAAPDLSTVLSRTRSESNPTENVTTKESVNLRASGHRASISAKFLSRSQRSGRSSASTVSAEEQRRRIEALKARINGHSSSFITNTTSSNTNKVSSFDRVISSSSNQNSSNKRTIQHQRSVDNALISPPLDQARGMISTSLKKNRLISKSCQNISLYEEFNKDMHNVIPSSPTLRSTQDVFHYDSRRSSTPLNKNVHANEDDRLKRRLTSNVWSRSTASPVTSPVKEHKTNKLNKKLTNSRRSLDTLTTNQDDVVMRRGGKNRDRNRRPRSMIIDTSSLKEIRQPLEFENNVAPHPHSDSENSDKLMNHVFETNFITSHQGESFTKNTEYKFGDDDLRRSPNETEERSNVDVAYHQNDRFSNEVVGNNDLLAVDKETELVNQLAAEVNSIVKNLTEDLDVERYSSETEIEAGHSKRLIKLYETGLVQNARNLSCSPFNDISDHHTTDHISPASSLNITGKKDGKNDYDMSKNDVDDGNEVDDDNGVENDNETENGNEVENDNETENDNEVEDDNETENDNEVEDENVIEDDDKAIVSAVTWDHCESVMRNLVQSYNEAAELQNTLLNEPASDHQKELLAVIARTYSTLENNIKDQRKRLEMITKMADYSLPYIRSNLFKELQKTLLVTTQSTVQSSNAEMFTLLDKYSNVLVDIIAKKMKNTDRLIE